MERTEIRLGKRYRDTVTGFEGIATAKHEYLNGCVRITITASELKEGKPVEPQTFDTEQLEYVNDGLQIRAMKTGGPGDVPAARSTPIR